jgi:hypothetical protein
MDELYSRRNQSGAFDEIVQIGHSILRTEPDRYAAAWRLAQAFAWRGYNTQNKTERREAAQTAMQYAETAIAQKPDGGEGHFMAAISIAVFGSSIGIPEALVRGIAPKFESAVRKAYELNKHFDGGSPIVALGRYYYELPWPLRDLEQSAAYLEEARSLHPTSLRGRLYLAETYYGLGKKREARDELAFVLKTGGAGVDDKALVDNARADLQEWFGATVLAAR